MNLNDRTRADILKAVLDSRFAKDSEALKKEREALGLKLWRSTFGEQNYRRINSLPDGWVPCYNHITLYIQGQTHEFRVSKPIRRPYDSPIHTVTDAVLIAGYREFLQRAELHKSKLEGARSQAHAVLKSCRTIERLLKAWPEVKKFIPKELSPTTTALAIPIASLNQLLGLK